jgi:hypothetical protein
MTMTTTKTLLLAAIAALSLGVANAMADGSGGSFPDYQSSLLLNKAPVAAPVVRGDQVPAGSSDVDTMQPGTATYIFNHHLYGAGGFSG